MAGAIVVLREDGAVPGDIGGGYRLSPCRVSRWPWAGLMSTFQDGEFSSTLAGTPSGAALPALAVACGELSPWKARDGRGLDPCVSDKGVEAATSFSSPEATYWKSGIAIGCS